MMFVVFFLCQFSQVMRSHVNQNNNDFYEDIVLPAHADEWSQDVVFSPDVTGEENIGVSAARNIIFIGSPDSEAAVTVKQWCKLIKAPLTFYDILPLYSKMDHSHDYMILIDGESLSTGCYMSTLNSYLRKGTTVVFLTLPPVQVIRNNEQLKDLLGITKIMAEEVTVQGIRIFEGAFVGGEAVYKAEKNQEKEFQDLDLRMPWYVTAEGSKSYMVGLLDESKTDRESFPRIMWRFSGGKTKVFAVNGDYLKSLAGLGMLDLILYESADFALYPVVNAQTSLFIDIPGMSDEQSDVMQELYYRDSNGVQRDIFFPGIVSVSERNQIVPTFLMRTRYDMDGDAALDTEHLDFYLEEIGSLSGEAGRSLRYTGTDDDLISKMVFDSEFYNDPSVEYNFRTAYVDSLSEAVDALRQSQESGLFDGIVSVAGPGDTDELFYYLNDDITFQSITQDATSYSYSRDLLARSLNTSVGYSSLMISMNNAFRPDNEDDEWENYFDLISSNISTYWHRFSLFEQTTLSESDYRIRKMLSLDYETYYQREDENVKITLFTDKAYDECWFLLRTHEQQVEGMTGGDWKLIEKDAYLIHMTGDRAEITLRDSDEVYTYENPF